jgi:hypothetical protein
MSGYIVSNEIEGVWKEGIVNQIEGTIPERLRKTATNFV